MKASSLKGLRHGVISFVSGCTKGCKRPGRAGHGGPRKGGTIIEVGFALVLWNQDSSNERAQLARQNIQYMRGDKEFEGWEKGTNE